eukprot:1980908-Rhodomonas_salina.1
MVVVRYEQLSRSMLAQAVSVYLQPRISIAAAPYALTSARYWCTRSDTSRALYQHRYRHTCWLTAGLLVRAYPLQGGTVMVQTGLRRVRDVTA